MMILKVQEYQNGRHLIATKYIGRGQMVLSFKDANLISKPTFRSVQVGRTLHADEPELMGFLNHSCRPNVLVDTQLKIALALRDIEKGEELNYFYPSTEWDMASPFECHCGQENCLGLIRGARYVAPAILSQHYVNLHIRDEIMSSLYRDRYLQDRYLAS